MTLSVHTGYKLTGTNVGVILYIVSVLVSLLIAPAGMLYGFFKQVYKRQFFHSFKVMDAKFLLMAVGIDRFGNIVCAELLTATMIKKDSIHPFGMGKETISSVLGKNEKAGTLTTRGVWLCGKLNSIDPGHTSNSIDLII